MKNINRSLLFFVMLNYNLVICHLHACENFNKSVIDDSSVGYVITKGNIIRLDSPILHLELIFDNKNKVKKIIPIKNEEALIAYTQMLICEKISTNELEFDSGWQAHRSMGGDKKTALMSFVGALSNFQLSRPKSQGYDVPINSEFLKDYAEFMGVSADKIINDFSSQSKNEGKILLDIKKIFLSWK